MLGTVLGRKPLLTGMQTTASEFVTFSDHVLPSKALALHCWSGAGSIPTFMVTGQWLSQVLNQGLLHPIPVIRDSPTPPPLHWSVNTVNVQIKPKGILRNNKELALPSWGTAVRGAQASLGGLAENEPSASTGVTENLWFHLAQKYTFGGLKLPFKKVLDI